MDCQEEQSYFSFCALLPLAIGVLSFFNIDKILNLAINGVGVGKINKVKNTLSVKTSEGVIMFPNVKLPSFDWEMYFTSEKIDVEDGTHDSTIVDDISMTRCPQFRDTIICEYLYSQDVGSEDIRGIITSHLDGLCYVFTVKKGEIIDYKKFIDQFLQQIEDY